MALSGMRGLSVFIYDVRNCQNKEQERLRVDKELGNIRTKFKSEKGISPYKKKKYVWKMLYIFMLGYDVDFGHMEAGSLISAPKYPEKQVEYITTSCLLNENHDFLRLAINTIRNDIIGRNETFQCLALTMVGNIGRKDFAESLSPDVQKLLMSSSCRPLVRKKAALCLLRLFRKNPDVLNIDGWPDQRDRMSQLLDELDLGVLTASPSLLVALVSNNHESYWNCVRKCVKILERLARNQDVPQEYTYYGIPSPWLQVKSMRALQYFPTVEDPNMRRSLFEVLQRVLMGTDVVKNVNKNNASHAVLFEALALVMHLDAEKKMMAQCVALLGKFIAVRELNIRYLGRENMARMLMVTDVHDIIKRHQAQIITSLKDPDISIRRRALDLLYGMCDVSNAKDIVEALLQCTAELAMWEELSLKAAILAEKFAPDLSWYVDVILQLIDKAGEFVSDDIWFRVVQFVTSNEGLQPYAVVKAREYLEKSAVHETMIKVSAYILGELGHLLGRRPGCSPRQLFSLIYEKLPTVPTSTIPLLLSSFAKILMHCQPADQELHNQIWALFQKMKAIQLSSYAKILMHPHLQGFLNYCVAQLIYPYIGEREEDESFTFLPDDIIVTEILPRLHIKPLFRFKCASKRYRSIISHPVFARNYLNRTYKNDNSPKSWSSSGLLATLLYPFTNMSSYGHGLSANVRDLTDTLNSGTQFPDDAVCVSYVSLPYNNSHRIRASSNGLVLSHFHDRSLNELIDPLCVSNPLTKHCVKLPKQGLKLYSVHWELAIATRRVQTGSTFLTYKVVAIQRFLGLDDAFTTVHIFSSDTGSWSTWKAFCSERGFALPKGCFAYNGILHFLDTDTGTSVLTYDPYESPDRFNQIPLPNGRQSSHSCLIFSGDKEMLKYCEIDSTGGSGVDRLSIWRLVHSEWCLEGEFRIPSVVYECRSLMVAPNPWNRDVICHPYVMINKFTVVNTRAGTMEMIRVLDDQTMLLEFYADLLIDNDYPLIPIELCPWSSPCYVSN